MEGLTRNFPHILLSEAAVPGTDGQFNFPYCYRPNALSAQAPPIWREREAYCDKTEP